jgi:shikimate dehydrogenase
VTRLPGRLVLLGHPVSHSLSPRFQNAALRAADIPLVYEALDVAPDALATTLTDLGRQNASGNVTIPHKEAVAALCVRRSALADRCGAVNTFWHDEGALVGDNTDVGGVDAIAQALLGEARA